MPRVRCSPADLTIPARVAEALARLEAVADRLEAEADRLEAAHSVRDCRGQGAEMSGKCT